jgi:hypothetical protein
VLPFSVEVFISRRFPVEATSAMMKPLYPLPDATLPASVLSLEPATKMNPSVALLTA